VRHAVDELQLGVRRPLLEAEEADDAVDVDGQEGLKRWGYQR
jgi:hypothetical protein